MKQSTYAAVARFVVKLVPHTAIIEALIISCEHQHASVSEAAACAYLQNRNLSLYPYWRAALIIGEGEFAELATDEEIAQCRDANIELFGWNNRQRWQRPRAA